MDPQQIDQATKLLRATFLTNLAVLQRHMPNVFEFYRAYEAKQTLLAFDDRGEVNLARDGLQIYPDSPRESSREQVEVFLKDPKNFRYFPQEHQQKGFEHYLHSNVLQDIQKLAKGYASHERYLSPLDVDSAPDCLCVLGAGLGYHIEMLCQKLQPAYLYLFEPDPDCLYAMLHCIDLAPIIAGCQARGGFLKITIGGGAPTFVNEISVTLDEQGPFNLARMLVYRHYFGDKVDEAFELIHNIAYRYVGGWGFFEDEAISISHTLSHAEHGIPLLRRPTHKEIPPESPVFIVGNGPSLDLVIDYLKANQHRAVIISCGTALRALNQHGVVPDIHIEVERTLHVYDWLSSAATPENYERTVLIGPNTLHPKVVGLFRQRCLYVKPHDAGGYLIQNAGHNRYLDLFFCAPTVTNGAAAVAVALGFKQLYLVGVDYGFRSEEHHHSKDSAYYQTGWKGETTKMEGHFEVDSNRDDKVFSTAIFDMSRGVMEILLEKHNLHCFNLSDGAKIAGASFIDPLQPLDLPLPAQLDKAALLQPLLAHRFDPLRNEDNSVRKQFFDDFHRLEQLVLLLMQLTRGENRPDTRQELHRVFLAQYKVLRRTLNDPNLRVPYQLLKGTFSYLQTTIMTYAYTLRDDQERTDFIHQALELFNEHLIALCEKLADRYDTHDDTVIYQ